MAQQKRLIKAVLAPLSGAYVHAALKVAVTGNYKTIVTVLSDSGELWLDRDVEAGLVLLPGVSHLVFLNLRIWCRWGGDYVFPHPRIRSGAGSGLLPPGEGISN